LNIFSCLTNRLINISVVDLNIGVVIDSFEGMGFRILFLRLIVMLMGIFVSLGILWGTPVRIGKMRKCFMGGFLGVMRI
jgi:hypothetical protein